MIMCQWHALVLSWVVSNAIHFSTAATHSSSLNCRCRCHQSSILNLYTFGVRVFLRLIFSQQTNSLSNFHAFRDMKYNARAWFNSLWKIRLPSRSDSTTVSAVRVKVSICPAHFVFIPFHQNEIVIAIGLCAQRTHITHALILRLRLFTGCTLHLLFVCKAQFNGLSYAVYAICMQTSVAHRFIKWVRK